MSPTTLLTTAALILIPAAASAQTAPGRTPVAPAPASGTATAAPQATTAAPQATTATPQAAAGAPTVGGKVYDSAGVELGTVESLTADAAIVNSGTAKVALPLSAIGAGAKGPTLSITKAELDAAQAAQQQQAAGAVRAKLVAGTPVSGVNGTTTLGTVKAADDQFVTLTTTKGDVKLPIAGFSMNAAGTVILGMTAEQFNAAVGGAAPAPAGN